MVSPFFATPADHAFHYHCISKWIKTSHRCPLDNRDWEMLTLARAEAPA